MAADDERLVPRTAQPGRTHPRPVPLPADEIGLSAIEAAATAEARNLITTLGEFDSEGFSLTCVAGVTAAEAVLREPGWLMTMTSKRSWMTPSRTSTTA